MVVVVGAVLVFATTMVVVVGLAIVHIQAGESLNISDWSAFEFTQATPHSPRLKAEAPWNMDSISVTADTPHLDRSWLNDDAR